MASDKAAARPPLTPLSDALVRLLALAAPVTAPEQVSTMDADGRVLAEDIASELQVPPQDCSAMDGYAVRLADVALVRERNSESDKDAAPILPVSQRIPAGAAPSPLLAGTAARIFTGAPVPVGADAILMQEDATPQPGPAEAPWGSVCLHRLPQPGQWIRRAGEDVTRGAVVLRSGTRLGPAELGLAASVGRDQLWVARQPRVALFSTGDELVMPGTVPPAQMRPGAIYNSNRFFLAALLRRLGCVVTDYGIVPDQRVATEQALGDAAVGHDLILTSGGVSVGEEDHVKPAVQTLGTLDQWQLAIKPGKPFAQGRIGKAHFMGLPGNPVSSFVTFLLLVRPFLLRFQGVTDVALRSIVLPAHFDWPHPDKRQEFLRVRRDAEGGLELFANQSSAVLTSVVWGDGWVDNPAGQPIRAGDMVRYVPFSEALA